jgi:hypothetical protein
MKIVFTAISKKLFYFKMHISKINSKEIKEICKEEVEFEEELEGVSKEEL